MPGWIKICELVYDGNTQRLTEGGFMEKPGIEPATPGLQDRFISFTTAASRNARFVHLEKCLHYKFCVVSPINEMPFKSIYYIGVTPITQIRTCIMK